MDLKNSLILLGTLWPPVAVFLGILIGLAARGKWRWLLLVIAPAIMLLPCIIFAEQLAYNGNMLFVALLMTTLVFLFIYYPLLLVIGILTYIKRNRQGGAG